MRRLFVLSLLALSHAASSTAPAATAADGPADGPAGGLEVFTLENTLIHWRAQGLRDAQGQVVVPADTVELTRLPGGGWLSRAGLGGELLDARGQRIAGPFVYIEQVDPVLDVLLVGTEGSPLLGGKGGLVRADGKMVAEPVHLRLHYLEGTGMFTFQRARRTGVMDAQGRVVLEPIHDSVTVLPPRLLLASKQDEVAVFDRDGGNLTGFQRGIAYQAIKDTPLIRECRAPVSENGDGLPRCRVLDAALRPAFAGEFSEIEFLPGVRRWVAAPWRKPAPEDAGTYSSSSNRSLLLLDEQGRRKAELQAQSIIESEGRLLITVDGPEGSYGRRTGLADVDGGWLFKPDYDQIEAMAIAFGEWREGKKPVTRQFRVLHWGQGGSYRTGVIDADGHLLVPLSDVQILQHYPGLDVYVAKQGDKIGVIDANGQWRIPARHQQTAPNSTLPSPYLLFADSDYSGKDDSSRYTLYDLRSGQPVFKAQYDYLSLEDSWWPLGVRAPWPEYVVVNARKGGKYGVIDLEENVVVPFKYDNLNSPDRWGRVMVFRGEDDEEGTPRDGLSPDRMARLREQVSREIRAQQAPLASAHAPYAGRYVPVDYADAARVSAAAAKGALSRPVAPMILVDSETAILDLDMITDRKRPPLDYLEYYCWRQDGFDILMPGAGLSEDACADPKAPRLVMRPAADEEWECSTCTGFGLPARWRRTDPAPNPALP